MGNKLAGSLFYRVILHESKHRSLAGANTRLVLASVFGAITDAMAAGDKVALLGFGTFSVSERAAREGRNPQTGETMSIPAKKVVKFKAGTKLTDMVK